MAAGSLESLSDEEAGCHSSEELAQGIGETGLAKIIELPLDRAEDKTPEPNTDMAYYNWFKAEAKKLYSLYWRDEDGFYVVRGGEKSYVDEF